MSRADPENEDLICAVCSGILRYYGHGGVGYLHVRVAGRFRGVFYGAGHGVPIHQRHNPIRRTV